MALVVSQKAYQAAEDGLAWLDWVVDERLAAAVVTDAAVDMAAAVVLAVAAYVLVAGRRVVVLDAEEAFDLGRGRQRPGLAVAGSSFEEEALRRSGLLRFADHGKSSDAVSRPMRRLWSRLALSCRR